MSDRVKHDETPEELIASMHALGFIVTRPELARWHRADLLPRPERRSLGRGRGMISVYPLGTANQLLALCTIHSSERRLTYVAWHLWWAGYDVPMHYARFFLEQAAASWQRMIDELRDLQKHPEALSDLLDRTAVMRFSRKALAQARKRTGRKNFPTFVGILVRVASGAFEGYALDQETETDIRERSILETGFGLRRARTERIGGAGPWLTDDTSEALQQLSHLLRDTPPGEDLRTTQDTDLTCARNEIRIFLSCIESFSTLLDRIFSWGALGLSAFSGTIREMGPQDQAMMLLFWMMFRSWGLGTAMDQLLDVAQQWHQIWLPMQQGLEQLRKEVPALTDVLAHKQIGDALRRKLAMEDTLDRLRQLAQLHQLELKAFFERHPELSQMMTVDASKPSPRE